MTSDRDTLAASSDPVAGPGGVRELVFDVAGMSCASCAARIERRLGRLEGVSARVNLATDSALITLAEGVTPQTVVSAIERLGYSARQQTAPGPRGGPATADPDMAEPGAAGEPAAGPGEPG